jgi:hypothetical protein
MIYWAITQIGPPVKELLERAQPDATVIINDTEWGVNKFTAVDGRCFLIYTHGYRAVAIEHDKKVCAPGAPKNLRPMKEAINDGKTPAIIIDQ